VQTDLRFVNAACNVLQCLPDDLYDITIDLATGEELDPPLVIPRHAVVRYQQSQPRPATGGVASAAPLAPVVPTPPTPRVPGKAKPAGTKEVFDADTGPKVTLFPHGKS
jgi:hypothetical protein